MRLSFLILTLFFFFGCTSNKDNHLLQTFTHKLDYHKELKRTEKVQLYENNITKIMLTATYLYTSNFENNDTRDEVFIVGINIYDESISSSMYAYHLTLNNKIAKMVKPLSKKDKILKNISFVTEWGSYYLVTFSHVNTKSFELVFERKGYNKGTFHFAKIAKYALEDKK